MLIKSLMVGEWWIFWRPVLGADVREQVSKISRRGVRIVEATRFHCAFDCDDPDNFVAVNRDVLLIFGDAVFDEALIRHAFDRRGSNRLAVETRRAGEGLPNGEPHQWCPERKTYVPGTLIDVSA